MISRILFLLCSCFFCVTGLSANPYTFNYTENCHQAYQEYMSLRLEAGNRIIRKEMMQQPRNLMATYIADYEDCILLLFNGNLQEYAQRKHHLDLRLELIDNGDEDDPWYRLCKSGIYFHWAMVQFRFGENIKAAATFRKSFRLIKENDQLFPDFPQNKIFLGMQEAVVGTIPDEYKWLASIFGMKGDVRSGLQKIAGFIAQAEEKDPLRNEAIIYYHYLKFYLLSEQEEVWKYINSAAFPTRNNLLHAFIKANVALNYRKGEVALQTLKEAALLKEYRHFPIFDYEMGIALQLQLDKAAIPVFRDFLNRYRGRIFVKDAWQQLTLAHYLHGNMQQATYSRNKIKTEGTASTDADKQARRFADSGIWPVLPLLQARLLIDGGYYQEALSKLTACNPVSLATATDKLEYHFRTGRVYDELRKDVTAMQYYQTTIDMGRNRKEHFAARSALQIARIHERNGRKQDAVARYNECLSMKGHDFQTNIDQQAKAGLNRLSK